jgi:hypothetical protein
MEIGFTTAFYRAFKKKIGDREEIKAEFQKRVDIF